MTVSYTDQRRRYVQNLISHGIEGFYLLYHIVVPLVRIAFRTTSTSLGPPRLACMPVSDHNPSDVFTPSLLLLPGSSAATSQAPFHRSLA